MKNLIEKIKGLPKQAKSYLTKIKDFWKELFEAETDDEFRIAVRSFVFLFLLCTLFWAVLFTILYFIFW